MYLSGFQILDLNLWIFHSFYQAESAMMIQFRVIKNEEYQDKLNSK